MTSNKKIVIIGCGVIGLTTAYRLLQEGYDVSIIAQYLPSDQHIGYTSTKAGAFYIPLSTRRDPWEVRKLCLESYKQFFQFIRDRPVECGVFKVKARLFIDETEIEEVQEFEQYGAPWWKDEVEGFKVLTQEEFPDPGIRFGFEYDTFVATPTHYLHFLLMECVKLGLKYRRYTVSSISEAANCFLSTSDSGSASDQYQFTKADLVINCSGIGAQKLIPEDDKIVYIKGQTVLVENSVPYLTALELRDPEYPEETVYVIPRLEGGTLLNGIYAYNDNSTHLDDDLAQRIMQRAIKYAPDLINTNYQNNKPYLKIVSHNIGIRPGRYESPRVEFEEIQSSAGSIRCIHNYGNGSSGYIQSFGTAEQVLQIISKQNL